jgi:hypothetical protein
VDAADVVVVEVVVGEALAVVVVDALAAGTM